jgi:mannosyl-oligosaccharide glucosidase
VGTGEFESRERYGKMVVFCQLFQNFSQLIHFPKFTAKEDTKTTVFFYVGNEGAGEIKLLNEPDNLGLGGVIELQGSLPVLGDFKLEVTPGPKTNHAPELGHAVEWKEQPLDRSAYISVQVPPNLVWKAKGNDNISHP